MKVVQRIASGLAIIMMAAGVGMVATASGAAAPPDCTTNAAIIPPNNYKIIHLDGTFRTNHVVGNLLPGDTVVGTFVLNAACPTVVVSGASYWAPSAIFSTENQKQQVLFDSATKTVLTGGHAVTVSVSVKIPTTGIAFAPCPNPHNQSSQTFNGNGGSLANGNQYASTCDGRPSANGNGNGNATGKPCQGCVGNADNKNPPGQFPNGTDHNNGYECDGNHGVGKGNPAHSSCLPAHFQMEFVVGPVIKSFVVNGVYTPYPSNHFIQAGSTLG
ncbi:MAG: hypothetical protein QOG64_616 [Acidimicrobiaceae bacterium]|nr:hypothetical protein [Acidimicrobiaceae bacterium]